MTDPETIGRETAKRLDISPRPWFINGRTGEICHGNPDDDGDNYPIDSPGDWEHAVRCVNGYDELAKRLEEVEGQRDALRERVEELVNLFDLYAAHWIVCEKHGDKECNCGYEDAVKLVYPLTAKEPV